MPELLMPRRKFLLGLAGLFCAPAIVRVESLMQIAPVTPFLPPGEYVGRIYAVDYHATEARIIVHYLLEMGKVVKPGDPRTNPTNRIQTWPKPTS